MNYSDSYRNQISIIIMFWLRNMFNCTVNVNPMLLYDGTQYNGTQSRCNRKKSYSDKFNITY